MRLSVVSGGLGPRAACDGGGAIYLMQNVRGELCQAGGPFAGFVQLRPER